MPGAKSTDIGSLLSRPVLAPLDAQHLATRKSTTSCRPIWKISKNEDLFLVEISIKGYRTRDRSC